MTTLRLAGTAGLALLLATGAFAQGMKGGEAGSGGAAPGRAGGAAAPGGSAAGAPERGEAGRAAAPGATAERPATPAAPGAAAERPANQATPGAASEPSSRPGAATNERPAANERPGAAANEPAGAGGAGKRAGATNITTEQRTKISTSIKNVNVREVTNVNVTNVSVGAAVPRTITEYWVPVPADIIAVVPAWAAFRVVRIGARILVIDPATLEIVDVLPV